MDEKIGHMPIKKMRIKVSQKGLSTRLVAQTEQFKNSAKRESVLSL